MRSIFWSRLLFLAVAAGATTSTAEADEYRLGRGDTLAIAVLGYPDLTRRAVVDAADQISFPFIGKIKAGARTTPELRDDIARLLGEKNILRGSEVTVEVAEYAPFYVSGDVTKPGAFPFRPGMTVRHAVALAGGYSARLEGVSVADLWGQQRSASIALVKAEARLARLQAELANKEAVDFSTVQTALVDKTLSERLLELETDQFNARRHDRQRELAHLKAVANQARRQISNLEAQLKAEEQNIKLLTEDLDRMKSLFERRIAAASRLSDAQQALALNRARFFTTSAQLAEVRRLETELERKAERFTDNERIKIMADAQEALVEVDTMKARVRVAQMKVEEARAQALPGTIPDPEVRIFRPGVPTGTLASESTEFRSGDVIQVRLSSDGPAGEPNLRRRQSALDRKK
jgi:polysaccharide biosynthesis/export protein